jgi:DNA replication protein DnaC
MSRHNDLAQDLAEADATGTRPELIKKLTRVDLLVIEDLGMRRLPSTAAEDLLEVSHAAMRPEPFWFLQTAPSKTGARC